jgi:DnaJ-domain-containing protein 1
MKKENQVLNTIIAYVVIYLVSFGIGYGISKLIFMYHYRKQFNSFKDFYRSFKNRGSSSLGMSVEEACKILGIKKKDLKKMSKNDLKRAYWKAAQKSHPDHNSGQNDEEFKNVNNAYSFMKETCYA